MQNMFPIVYLNENLRYCNENLAWGKQEPLIHPYVFEYTTKGECWSEQTSSPITATSPILFLLFEQGDE